MRIRRDQQGFTLVELLVAAALASIGFLGLAALHATAIRATSVGRNTSVATTLATEQLEAMRRVPSSALASLDPAALTVGAHEFVRSTTVTGTPPGDAKQVTVDVDWYDQFGPHQVRLVTVIGP
jgi:prepilin-type N-terminal cleavage/methylation domain-containing protein